MLKVSLPKDTAYPKKISDQQLNVIYRRKRSGKSRLHAALLIQRRQYSQGDGTHDGRGVSIAHGRLIMYAHPLFLV